MDRKGIGDSSACSYDERICGNFDLWAFRYPVGAAFRVIDLEVILFQTGVSIEIRTPLLIVRLQRAVASEFD